MYIYMYVCVCVVVCVLVLCVVFVYKIEFCLKEVESQGCFPESLTFHIGWPRCNGGH